MKWVVYPDYEAMSRALLLASGQDKVEIVARVVEGPVTTEVPASVLQMHPQVTVLLDQDAASILQDDERRRRRQAEF